MKVSRINSEVPWMPAIMEGGEAAALDDLTAAYSPYGQIRNLLMVYRPGIGIGGYQGSATPMSLDYTLARMLGLSGASAGLDREIYGGGKGLTLFDTVASTLGEAVERMLGSMSSLREVDAQFQRRASYIEMIRAGHDTVGPDVLTLCADEQVAQPGFLCERWEPETILSWVAGENLLTGNLVWVPEQLVHLFYVMQFDETRIGFSSSGGLATHITDGQALHHAILELIERDAINLSWYCRVPPKRIDIDLPLRNHKLQGWIDQAVRSGVELMFYSHTLDIAEVSVVTVIAIDPDAPKNAYLAGGGVGLHVEEAMRSAVAELVQAERMVRIPSLAPAWELTGGYDRMFGIGEDARASDFDNFIQVVSYYGFPSNQEKLDWYFRAADQLTVRLSELPSVQSVGPADDLEAVLETCRSHGLTPISFDFTPATFDAIRLRKVFIPELVPAFPPNMPMLGHRRYRHIRQELGVDDRPWGYADLTTDPLPFP
ncbi:MAG: hypothetical protein B5766_00525 [Candidatus Lumbricidophila eiseniae]|uniref:YcaO domain-containing protein n=1 Tax=Candidatus Lumbricidiphila eiseniae TaxID=1969409 RepID=A0A2A6FUS2_9MICO|nr:MAG: hypothetical protein B5766_00525 [Candidatus Lumbricidophila eiseniae]